MTHLSGKEKSYYVQDIFTRIASRYDLMNRLMTAGGRVLNHGRSVREFTSSQRQAVFVRDQGCRYPGCTAGPRSCDIHHVIAWELGGQSGRPPVRSSQE